MVHGKDTGPRPLGEAVKPLTCVSNFVTGPAKPTIVCFVGHSPKCNWQSFVFVDWELRLAEYLRGEKREQKERLPLTGHRCEEGDCR